MQQNNRHPSDPRPEMPDHKDWADLLWNSWHWDKSLYYLLHGIRCGGAEIVKTQGSFKLLPGEWSEPEWEDIKQNRLSAFRDQLVEVFKITRMGRVQEGEVPEQFKQESLKYAWMR